MRYLRLFSVLLLSSFLVTGCHRGEEPVLPPVEAEAPIVTTLPPIPPLTFPDVQLAKPEPPTPLVEPAVPKKPPNTHTRRVRHRRKVRKALPDTTSASQATGANPAPGSTAAASGSPATESSLLGQLSADDATNNPHLNIQTQRLIRYVETGLKKVPPAQRLLHKEDVSQINSFLAQAKQAWAMNDVVGAQTLANKAKILLDELRK